MANQWFKFYGQDYLSSPTIARLTASERSCWVTLLSLASLKDNRIEFLDEHTLLSKSGLDPTEDTWNETIGVLEKFIKFKMIKIEGDFISLIKFDQRQEYTMTSTERSRKFRDKIKNATQSNGRNENATLDKNRIDKNRIDILLTSFASFYKKYPKKKGKEKAKQKWISLAPNDKLVVEIMDALEKVKKSEDWQKDGGQFIPHPATWIYQKRWEDEVDVPKPREVKRF